MKATDRVSGGVWSPARRILLTGAALVLGVSAALAQLPPAGPSPKVLVADVIPQGLHNVPPQRVTALLKTRAGAEYNPSTIEEDVRRLYDTHSFANIQVQERRNPDGSVIVYFQFSELPNLIQEIIYEGAKHASPDELNTATGLRKGIALNPIANQQACHKIVEFYNEKGYALASCELLEGGRSGDSRVVFTITEGHIARVASIDFTGNEFVSKARLHTQINTSAEFLHLPLGGRFNPTMADLDVLKLEEYYRSFGYHDVHVSREVQWEPDQRTVHLVFHIHEGVRYRVHGVDVLGSSTYARDQLMSYVKLEPGEYVNEGKTKADAERIKGYYGYRGSDSGIITNVVYRDDLPGGQADIQYQVQERPPATVGQIIIVGNEVTRQNVILRQVPLYPGQVLTYPDLRLAENNLKRLNIFENTPDVHPTVSVLDPEGPNPVKDVLVTVQETTTGSLLFGVGVNSDAGLTGSIVLNERNFDITRVPTSLDDLLSGHAFRGAGQEFRVEAVPGTQLQRYTVSWREPFLFDTPYSLGVSGYYYDRLFNEYEESRLGMRITLGRQLNRYWSASLGLRVEDVGVHSVPADAPEQIQSVEGDSFLVGLRAAITRDSRDSFLRPTEGSMVEFAYEQVTGDFNFPVFSVEANKYFTIYERPDQSGRHVLAYHGELSIEGSNAPVFERFYAGGFRSMRGFEFRGVSPDINGYKVGGDFMFLNSLEYQIPVLANDQIYLVGFVDSGTVDNNFNLSDYRVTAGVGARIVVPMLGPVPIALDFGFPIVKDNADRTQIFSFWVGFFH